MVKMESFQHSPMHIASNNKDKENLISHNGLETTYPEIDCAILALEETMAGIKSDKDFDRVFKRNEPVGDSRKYRQGIVRSLTNEELHNTMMNIYTLEEYIQDYKENIAEEMRTRLVHSPESIPLDLRNEYMFSILE